MRFVKCAGIVLLGVYGVAGAFRPQAFWLLDEANLLFHEAGHVIFNLFGEYPGIWGGTFFQILLPLGIAAGFWKQNQPCSASVMLWWSGQNFFGISTYIKDARCHCLPYYVGGGIHDWEYLLRRHHLLELDQLIGNVVWVTGILIMLAACFYGIKTCLSEPDDPIESL